MPLSFGCGHRTDFHPSRALYNCGISFIPQVKTHTFLLTSPHYTLPSCTILLACLTSKPLFLLAFLHGISPPLPQPTHWTTTSKLPYIDPLYNPVILHFLHMAETSENASINFIHPFHYFPDIQEICTTLFLKLSSFHIIVSLPCIRTGTNNDSCKRLAHSSCKPLP